MYKYFSSSILRVFAWIALFAMPVLGFSQSERHYFCDFDVVGAIADLHHKWRALNPAKYATMIINEKNKQQRDDMIYVVYCSHKKAENILYDVYDHVDEHSKVYIDALFFLPYNRNKLAVERTKNRMNENIPIDDKIYLLEVLTFIEPTTPEWSEDVIHYLYDNNLTHDQRASLLRIASKLVSRSQISDRVWDCLFDQLIRFPDASTKSEFLRAANEVLDPYGSHEIDADAPRIYRALVDMKDDGQNEYAISRKKMLIELYATLTRRKKSSQGLKHE